MDETQLSPEDLEYASRLPLPGQEVSRAGNILGAARQGLVSSVVTPLAGIARLTGMEQAPRLAEILRRNQEEGGGMYPTNPDMSKDFSTGVARAVGAAPATMLQAAGGLPVLVGGGALSGVESYGERKEDYDRRLAAGQLEPGEEAPSALSEVGKGAASNAAFLLGGMGAGRLAAPILSRLSGAPARILAGYGATVGGNLAGSAAARKIETGKFGYETPAQAGEDIFTAAGTFGPIPTKHLLEAPASKYMTPEARATMKAEKAAARAAAQAAADAASEAAAARERAATTSFTSETPDLNLSTMSQRTSRVEQGVMAALPAPRPEGSMEGTPGDVPQWPYVGQSTPGERNIIQQSGVAIAQHMMGEGDIRAEALTSDQAFSKMDREAAARQHALFRIREALDILQTPGEAGNELARQAGLSRNHATAAFIEANRILTMNEPVSADISVQQQLATQQGAAALGPLRELVLGPRTPESGQAVVEELQKPYVQAELARSGMRPMPTDERLQPQYVRDLTALLNSRDAEIAAAHADALKATAAETLKARLAAGKPIAETPTPPETVEPPPTTPTNETGQNIQQIPDTLGQTHGPAGPLSDADNAPTGVRGVGVVGPGAPPKPVQEPGGNAPVGQADNAGTGLRGQDQLGGQSAQRPVLSREQIRDLPPGPERDAAVQGWIAENEARKARGEVPIPLETADETAARLRAKAQPPTPESPATLAEQQKQLVAGRRRAMLFTPGETPLDVPEGMVSVIGPSGTWHFNPEKLSARDVVRFDQEGRTGELLNLGAETKAEATAAPGKSVVLTEHTPEGVEVRASVTSEGELEAKRAEFEKTKTPGNIIGTRTADEVISARKSATELDTTSPVTGEEYLGGLARPGQRGVALGTVGDKVRIKWEDGKVTDEDSYKVHLRNPPENAGDIVRNKVEPAMKKGQPIPSEWVDAVQPPRVKGVVENVPQAWIRRRLEIEGYREKDGQWVKVAEREGPPEDASKGNAADRAKYHNRVIKMSDAELAKELAKPQSDRWKWETLQISKLYADLRAHNREAEAMAKGGAKPAEPEMLVDEKLKKGNVTPLIEFEVGQNPDGTWSSRFQLNNDRQGYGVPWSKGVGTRGQAVLNSANEALQWLSHAATATDSTPAGRKQLDKIRQHLVDMLEKEHPGFAKPEAAPPAKPAKAPEYPEKMTAAEIRETIDENRKALETGKWSDGRPLNKGEKKGLPTFIAAMERRLKALEAKPAAVPAASVPVEDRVTQIQINRLQESLDTGRRANGKKIDARDRADIQKEIDQLKARIEEKRAERERNPDTPVAAIGEIKEGLADKPKEFTNQVKKVLTATLEEALKTAPEKERPPSRASYQPGFKPPPEPVRPAARPEVMSIHIPGDGEFRITKTKEAIEQVLKGIRSMPGAESQEPRGPRPVGKVELEGEEKPRLMTAAELKAEAEAPPVPPEEPAKPAAPTAAPAPLKRPWEMTREEFFDYVTQGSKPARTPNDPGYIVRGTYGGEPTLNWWEGRGGKAPPAGAKRATYGEFAEEQQKLLTERAKREGLISTPADVASTAKLDTVKTPEAHQEVTRDLETRIGELEAQINADQKVAETPRFSPEKLAAIDRLMKNRAAREDLIAERGNLPPEPPPPEPVNPAKEAERAKGEKRKRKAIEAPDVKTMAELAASYKRDPQAIEAFDKQAKEEHLPKAAEAAGKIMGQEVPVIHDSPLTDGIGVVPTREGGVEYHIGKDYLAKLAAIHGDKAPEALAKALEEEGIHVAVLKAIHEAWSKLGEGRPDFYEFSRQVMGKVSGEILGQVRTLRNAGKHKEAFAIEEAVRHAKEIYDGQLDGGNSMSGRQILEKMTQDPKFAFTYANELLRQFAQLRKNGQITETVFQKLTNFLHQLYTKAQEHLKKVVGLAHEGGLGETAKGILNRVEELTANKPAEGKAIGEAKGIAVPERISHLEEKVLPWYAGADDQNARTNSRDVPGYSPRKAAEDFLRDSDGEGAQERPAHERTRAQLDSLAGFEAGRGRLIDRQAFLDANPLVIGQGEHQVLFDPKTERWVKFTRPGAAGIISERLESFPSHRPEDSLLGARGATPLEYLGERMRLANERFGDDQQYHGVWLDKDGEAGGLVMSQPHVEGRESTPQEIAHTLAKEGFKRVGPETWYRPSDRMVLDDTAPRNFITKEAKAAGIPAKATPIDVPMRIADDAYHAEAMRQIESGNHPTPDTRQVIEAPKLVEKVLGAVKEKVREKGRPWWFKTSKAYRRFSDALSTAVGNIETISNNEGVRLTNSLYSSFADATKKGFAKAIFGLAEAGKELKEMAEVAFPLREAGFGTAVTREAIEAARAKLDNFIDRIDAGLQSTDKEVVAAAEKLKPIYDKAKALIQTEEGLGAAMSMTARIESETSRQIADAKSRDIDINEVDDYIRRVYEENESDKAARFVPNNSGKGGGVSNANKGFLKPRAYDSAVEAMEHGLRIANMDTAQLVGHGEASLQKVMGEKQLYRTLRATRSPVTNKPVITDDYKVYNDRIGEEVKIPPDGYQAVQVGGRSFFIEQNVAPLFRALTAPSWVRQNIVGNALVRYAAGFKNGTLIFDSYHSTRLAATLMGLLGQAGDVSQMKDFIRRGQAALDYRPEDLADLVRHGVITKEEAKWALDAQKDYDIAAHAGVNFGKQLDNLYEQVGKPFFVSILSGITKHAGYDVGHGIETFNKFVFQKQARAAMMVGFRSILERNTQRYGTSKTVAEIQRMSALETNEIFGNLGRQGWLKSRTGQDIARLFMLAPQWNEGRIRFQGRALGQGFKALVKPFRYETTTTIGPDGQPVTTRKLVYQPPGNAVGTMLALAAASFAGNQLINGFTRKQPTWDNEDGHKLDAWIPGGKNGFFYSPLNLSAEDLHTIMKYGARSSPLETVQRIAMNKASGLVRGTAALAGTDNLGRPLPGDVNRITQAARGYFPIPIVAGAVPGLTGKINPDLAQKGDWQRQMFGMAGLKLDRAETPEQRIRMAANKAFPTQFPKSSSPGDFARLRNLVSNEKLPDATNEILRLVAKGKTEQDLLRSFAPTRTIGQSRAQEALLLRTPAAAVLRPQVMADRSADYDNLRRAINTAKQSPKYHDAVIAGRAAKQPVQ